MLASTMIYRICKDQGSGFNQTVMITGCYHTKNFCHTGKLESFHSVALKYKLKRNHFSYDGMIARTILSFLGFNNNTGRSRKGSKLKYSKPLNKWVGVNVYGNKTHKWRKEILERVILGNCGFNFTMALTVLQVYQNALHQFPT
ncbi:hypothetical protein PR048_022998 [Dryococelus australis]|uniref:Uncharacterized protein n=1 Tax=Dryococelus australis TaxID=614101 RepID=A0ABQ9GSW6_9NEOP|nr:hypothetical protein PR048_022998 [Dryococelus australis]